MDRIKPYKRILVWLWFQWESLFHILFQVKQIDPANKLYFSRVKTYHGQAMLLDDGEEIRDGDRIIELHFNNRMLFHMLTETGSMVQLAVGMIRSIKLTLPLLAKQVEFDPNMGNIKGICGITMIHRGTKQLGFTIVELPSGIFSYLTKFYLRLLLSVINPEGKQLLELKGNAFTPKIVALSVKELGKRYRGETS
jgi:peptidoglycan-N-acetylglucosamine deacetylase